VRQLEQFLQTRLLERTGRGIKATAAGMALLAHSEQIDRAVNSAMQSVSAFSQEVNGAVTLGTGATACIHLPPLLQHLRQQHPLLTVGVTTGNTLDIVRAVEENRPRSRAGHAARQGRSLAVTRG
jgi:DNA-binding transcriptional LysR family regulator